MKNTSPLLNATPVEATIETLGGLGDGIGQLEGKPLFVPKSVPGDRLKIRIVHQNHDGLHGAITEILTAGPDRAAPPCPHFFACGGCRLQHLAPARYREFKTRMFRSALDYAGLHAPDAEMIFVPAGARRRVEFTASRKDGRLFLGFNELRSNTPAPVDNCLVLEPELQALIAPLNDELSKLTIAEHIKSVSLTAADSGIDMVITLKNNELGSLATLEALAEKLALSRVSVHTSDKKLHIVSERNKIEMKLGNYHIPLPPDSFLQATRQGQETITNIAVEAVKSAGAVVDLFSGLGSYSFPLSRETNVHAVEGDAAMVGAMRAGIAHHGIKTMTAEKRDLFKNPLTAKELQRFRAAIINPPRAGAKGQTEQLAQSNITTIVMVSCNPATFSRDAKILANAGFKLTEALGVDQFVYSPYLEIVAVFQR